MEFHAKYITNDINKNEYKYDLLYLSKVNNSLLYKNDGNNPNTINKIARKPRMDLDMPLFNAIPIQQKIVPIK